MSNLPKNARQFSILHTLANFPMANLRTLAKLTDNSYADIVKIKSSLNYDHWIKRQAVDKSTDADFISDLFGGFDKRP